MLIAPRYREAIDSLQSRNDASLPRYLLYVKGVSSSSGYVRYLHKNTYRPTGKLKHQVSPASATICSSIWITNFKPLMARIAIFGLRQT